MIKLHDFLGLLKMTERTNTHKKKFWSFSAVQKIFSKKIGLEISRQNFASINCESEIKTIEGGKKKSRSYNDNSQKTSTKQLLTIVTVTFNSAIQLEKTIKNVASLSSDVFSIQYIVIDGGSHDQTIDILQKYNEYIYYWMSSPDDGIYDAMNKAWFLAKDDSYMLYLGAGDLIYSLPSCAEISTSTAVCGSVHIGDSRIFKSSPDWKLKLGNTIHHQALLVHKSLSLSPPFNQKYKIFADYDFNARLYNSGVNFTFSSSFSAYALPGGVTSKRHTIESLKVTKENFGYTWCLIAMLYDLYGRLRQLIRVSVT